MWRVRRRQLQLQNLQGRRHTDIQEARYVKTRLSAFMQTSAFFICTSVFQTWTRVAQLCTMCVRAQAALTFSGSSAGGECCQSVFRLGGHR